MEGTPEVGSHSIETRLREVEAQVAAGGGGVAAHFYSDFIAINDFDETRRSFGTLTVPEGQVLIEAVFTGTISTPDPDAAFWVFDFLADSPDPQVSVHVVEDIRTGMTKGFSIPCGAVVTIPEGGLEFDLTVGAVFLDATPANIADPAFPNASMSALVTATLLD